TRTQFGVNAGLKEDSPFDRLSADAAKVALTGFDALMAGRPVVIDGLTNRLGAFITRFLPRSAVRRIAANLLQKMD
ncbi:MAG: SDR family NAD(P)-dependent oxidoreductase, partial [Sutterella sp.]